MLPEGFLLVVAIAFFVEVLVETLKQTTVPQFIQKKIDPDGNQVVALLSIALGVIVCISAGADLTLLIGINLSVPYVGAALTGILVSRGANFVHDFYRKWKVLG